MTNLYSMDIEDLISKLLNKDPLKRLGYGKKGFKELKSHWFFRYINFDNLSSALKNN